MRHFVNDSLTVSCNQLLMGRRTGVEGFTLIEMSIVLVIIGLIVGGVLVGQDMVRSAQLRKLMKEALANAVATFKGKYYCLPGDCSNATAFGFSNNGNGDSIIGPAGGYLWSGSSDIQETVWAWQELNASGLYAADNTAHLVLSGYGVYSRFRQCTWFMGESARLPSGSNPGITGPMGSVLALRSATAWNPGTTIGCVTPTEANALDSKIDDGYPYTGQVQASGESTLSIDAPPGDVAFSSTACGGNEWGPSPIPYNTSAKAPSCDMLFRLGL